MYSTRAKSLEVDSTVAGLLSAVRQFHDYADLWHRAEHAPKCVTGDTPADALYLHAVNFHLWHHEDAVRRPGVADGEVARRKRAIDDLNARRNAAVEHIDVTLLNHLDPQRDSDASLHTETPGRIVDRLSILVLRIFHANRTQVAGPHVVELNEQYDDLLGGLERFLYRMKKGEVRFKLYRQFKAAEQRGYCALFETRGT